MERGYFIQPASSAPELQQLREVTEPIAIYIEDRCVVEKDAKVRRIDLYQDFCAWCEQVGQKSVPTDAVFGRDIGMSNGGHRSGYRPQRWRSADGGRGRNRPDRAPPPERPS
jgi:hypothetical protein